MEGQYSWKRTDDMEIDLIDFGRRFIRQWKKTAVCAMVSAIVFGGYGWLRSREAVNVPVSVADQMEEVILTEEEERPVADAVQLENEIRGLETYLDNSVLMQIDPYHKSRVIMLYCIDHAKRQEIASITESYLTFVLNGGASDMLEKYGSSWEMDKSYMAELISVYQKTYSFPYQITVDEMTDSRQTQESLFYVEIAGKDAGTAKKMAQDMQNVLTRYSSSIKEHTGNHRLTLVSSMENVTIDNGLQSLQHDKKAALSSGKAGLKAAMDAFNQKQMAAYQKLAAGDEDAFEESEREEYGGKGRDLKLILKYILAGLLGGVFIYGCVYSCWYLYCDLVKTTEEMKRRYTFPVYGGIPLSDSSRQHKDLCGHAQEQIQNRIRLACQRHKITKLCASAVFQFHAGERECLENMAQKLKEWEITLEVTENATADIHTWDHMKETGTILEVCRIGTTTHRMIDETMSFYEENDISVIGSILFC